MDWDADDIPTHRGLEPVWALVVQQRGLVTREQCLQAGLTDRMIRGRLSSGRWVTVRPGVYQTVPGQSGWWFDSASALLSVGPRAAWAFETAGYAWGLLPAPPRRVHLLVDAAVKHHGPTGVQVHRSRHAHRRVDDLHWPWRTTPAETVLDLAERAGADEVSALLGRTFQRGLTTGHTLLERLDQRARHSRRDLLTDILAEVSEGAESAMEVRFVRHVERPHGLPQGRRQATTLVGGLRVHDVAYEPWLVLVELDGTLGHVGQARVADGRRDRRSATVGWLTVRAFWGDVAGAPCELAVEVGAILRARGWRGRVRRCRRPTCDAPS